MTDFNTILKPELCLVAIIFILLILKIFKHLNNKQILGLIQILLLLNFISGFFLNQSGDMFDTMYHTTPLIILQKNILNLGVYLISLLFTEWYKKHAHLSEFFILLLAAQLGMFFLISSNNFILFFLSLELATIPIAAMANFNLNNKKSSESALKLILTSAFSSGILLFGISLIYGTTGTINFSTLSTINNNSSIQIIAFVFLITAFAFKLSIVPFHFWTADVYEGAPIAVTAFLSTISKAAVTFVFLSTLYKIFQSIFTIWYILIIVFATITMLVGNLFALRQQNIKRFLAFSSIAQIGFILIGISSNSIKGSASVIYFILIYIFSTLAAFSVASIISDQTKKENIKDYKGLYQTNPFLCWILALALFSLAGIPPTAGFFGKLFLLSAGASNGSYLLIIFAALNMIISLYYYLNIIKAMFMDKNETPISKININPFSKFALIICSIGILCTGLFSWIYDFILELCK